MSHATYGIRGRYDETPLPPEALEVISDVLLRVSEHDREYPSYTETLLAGRSKRTGKSEHYFGMAVSSSHGPEAPALELPDAAELTEPDSTIWRLYCDGVPVMHIAQRVDMPRRLVRRHIHNILTRAASRRTAFDDLRDVYHSEVTRQEYRKPTHCPTHPCDRLGYCKYRV